MAGNDLDTDVRDNQIAEDRLVVAAQEGDSAAFSRLVRIYQRRAVSVAYRLVGNTEDACDVAQEAFLRAYRSLGQLENPSRFGPWLMRTVSNLSLNFRRSRKNSPTASLDDTIEVLGEFLRPGTRTNWSSVDDDAQLPDEVHQAVSTAIEQLPDKQRLALVLFSVEGMPQKEVAQILECSVELVKWNVFQARKKLRKMLADYL